MAYIVRAVRDHATSWLLTVPEVPELVVRATRLEDGLRNVATAIGAYIGEQEPQVEVVVDFAMSASTLRHPGA